MWILIYIVAFLASAFIGGPLITKIQTRDNGFSKIKWDDSVGRIYKDLPYDEGKYHKYDLYVPANRSRKAYGLFVYIHGGGFTGGDKEGDAPTLKHYAARGYVAAGINYTVQPGAKYYSIYQMSQEIKKGVKAVYVKAEELGYHLDQMVVAGGSAGSMLAMIYAYRDAVESPIPVKGCIQACGPTCVGPVEYGVCDDFTTDEKVKAAAEYVSTMTGDAVTPEMIRSGEYMQSMRKVSPSLLVDRNTAPTLFAHGKCDKIVPYTQAEYLLEALQKHHVAYDFMEFPKSGHRLQWEHKRYIDFLHRMDIFLDTAMPVG